MARISTYGLDGAITDDDRLLGSSYVSGSGVNKIYNTANYKLSDIVEYLDGKITLAAIDDNAISALQLNVSGNGTSGYVLISDGDGSFSWSSSIPTLTSTSTLTNKTLTSPTITGTGAIAGVFTGNITGNVAGNVAGNITGTVLTATQGTIDHDSLSGFVANEHIDWTVDQGSTEIHSGNYTDTNTNQLTTFTLRGTTNTTSTTVNHGDTITIAAGTGITTTSTSDGVITIVNTVTDTNTQLSAEEVQDIAGPLVATGGTKTGISVTYDDVNNNMDFVVASQTDENFTTADHDKLDTIEVSATADQTNAEIKAAVEAASDSNTFTDADHTKLNAIEALADVTDATNVTAAGALMDSEVTNLADVKAFDTTDYATAAQGTKADSAQQPPSEGAFANGDKTKLDGIETAATADQTGAQIKTLYQAESNAFTDAQFTKLSNIETAATADQTNAQIKTAYEANSDTNEFSDAEQSKLAAIEASATADQSNAEIVAAVEAGTDSNTFTDADHSKLNNIEASADVTDVTNVVAALSTGTGVNISSEGVVSVTAVALTTVQTAVNQTAHLALTAQEGDIVVRSDENKTYCHNGGSAGTMADYTLLATPTDTVLSVAGNTGVVSADQIATAVEAATDSNTFADADHVKLNAIEALADVTDATNVTAAGALMDGEVDNLADVKSFDTSDYLASSVTTISAAQAAAITANTAKNTNVTTDLTITGTTGARTIVSSDGTDAIIPIATTSASGVMSKVIFDEHILNNAKATDVNHNVSTNLTATTAAAQITINSSDGDNVIIGEATDTIAGLMSTTHHDKLDGIEASATADQTAAQIRTLVGTGNSNFVPSAGTAGHFLKHDGTFGLPSYYTHATNANLTGHVTSVGNATVLGSFTVAQLSTALSDASISGNNSGDQTLPTDFVSAASGGTFAGLVSGITPTADANFVTKAYADGLTPGAGVFVPLAGGDMTGPLTNTTGVSWGTNLKLINTNDDDSPTILSFEKDTASPADNDYIGFINYRMDNSNGDIFSWVELSALAIDVTDASESSAFRISTWGAGTEYTNTLMAKSGNVGIGIGAPTEKLEVYSGSIYINGENAGLVVDSVSKRVGFMKYNGHEAYISRVSGQDFGIVRTQGSDIFDNNNLTTDLYVKGDGMVGIGIAAPITKLHVSHTGVVGDAYGLALVENTSTSTGAAANSALNVKSKYGTSQFMQWEHYGLRIGSRILANSSVGDLHFTAGADSVKMIVKASGDVAFTGNVTIGDYFKMGSAASYMGVLGFNRNTTTGAMYNGSYGGYQLQNYQGTLQLQVYTSGGGLVGTHTFSTDGNVTFAGTVTATGIVNIGGIGSSAAGALANIDINDTNANGTSTTYLPNITFKAAGVLKAQIGKLSGSTNAFTAAKNIDGPVNIISSDIHSGHTHNPEYIFGYEPGNAQYKWGLNLVDGSTTPNSLYISAEGLHNDSSIFFGGYTNALLVTRISLNQTLGTWLYDCPDAGTSNVSVKWRKYNIGGYMANMIDFEDDGDIKNINGSYGTISSDERVKENIVDATSKLDDILSLKVKNFNFIGDDKKQIGLIAQEVEEIFPSWVNTRDTRIYKTHDEEGIPLEEQGELVSGYEDGKSLKVGMEFAILTKAIQELEARVKELENK